MKTRTLSYRRVVWYKDKLKTASFEDLLRKAMAVVLPIENTRIEDVDGAITELRHHLDKKTAYYLHVAKYTPNEEASIVPMVSGVSQGDLDTYRAPENQEFLDGDLMMRVEGDNILLCASGISENFVKIYLRRLVESSKISPEDNQFDFLPVANTDVINILNKEGVSKLKLKSSLYKETFDESKKKTFKKSLIKDVWEGLLSIIGEDLNTDELLDAENLQVSLLFSFDKRKKGADLSGEVLSEMANVLTSDAEEGYQIITGKNNVVTSNQINIKRQVKFEEFGKTIRHKDAWQEMDAFYAELLGTGVLQL